MRAPLPLALVACTLGRLAACASDGSAAPEPPPAAAAQQVAPPSEPPEADEAPTSQPVADGYASKPTSVAADGSEVYGGTLNPALDEVALADLLAEPERYRDQAVRTRGTVERVCKNQGCWMELRGEDATQQIRAPMAGHAYSVPQKAVGKPATVQGRVVLRGLTPEQKAHYAAEGARATDVRVSIEATAVALH